MKLIFLDIDGVMNHRTHFVRSRQHQGQEFSPLAVRNLREIIKATGAKIVLSSTWRKGLTAKGLKELFAWYDLDEYILGKTPVLNDQIRGLEIQEYIKGSFQGIESFVILDDDADMGELLPYLVQTSNTHGLTDEKREEAIKILMREANNE
jgi:hypothetical protein